MKKLLLLILCMTAFTTLSAQIRGEEIQVLVQPDHQDWTYQTGEKAAFNVSILKSGTLLNDVSIDLAAGPEMYQDVKKQTVLKDGTLKLSGTMRQPGFYRVDVTAHVGGKDYKGACGAAFSPELLQPSTVMPADFKNFWQDAVAEARNPFRVLQKLGKVQLVNNADVAIATSGEPNGFNFLVVKVFLKNGSPKGVVTGKDMVHGEKSLVKNGDKPLVFKPLDAVSHFVGRHAARRRDNGHF